MKRQGFGIFGLALVAISVCAQTPVQNQAPQQTIREDRVTRNGKSDEPPQASARSAAMNTVLSSTEDLNSIRDAYLSRLAGDGCAPDVAVRVAQLRAKLHGEVSTQSAQQSSIEVENVLFALASDWYKNPLGENSSSAGANVASVREAGRAKLLDEVLIPRDRPAASPPQAAETAQSIQAELDRLLAGCRSAAR